MSYEIHAEGKVAALRAQLAAVTAQRDELLRGIRSATAHYVEMLETSIRSERQDGGLVVALRIRNAIEEAIARAQPEQPPCHLCHLPMPDGTDGHGLGECVPVCPTCDGTGIEQQPQPSRDWPEDAVDQDNGRYQCKCCHCGSTFIGHKLRVTCRACTHEGKFKQPAESAPSRPAALEAEVAQLRAQRDELLHRARQTVWQGITCDKPYRLIPGEPLRAQLIVLGELCGAIEDARAHPEQPPHPQDGAK